jgi:hypothetical protein
MVDRISGDSPISRPESEFDKQSFNKAVNLFQQSLQAYEQSDIPAQKAKFKDVMDKCLQVIQQTAREAIRAEAQKTMDQVDKDYQSFLDNDNPQTYKQLNSDLDHLKRG